MLFSHNPVWETPTTMNTTTVSTSPRIDAKPEVPLKALIIGHGCNPYTSSEPGLTWNWASHMSDYCSVHLVAHPQNREEVNRFLAANPRPNLKIHWVDVSSPMDYWNPKRGDRGIRFHYVMWLRKACKYALALQKLERFDVVHHVGWGTCSVPSPFWKLEVPLIWGPIGGGQAPPRGLMPLFGWLRWKESLRTLRLRLLPLTPALRRVADRTAVVLTTNRETANLLSSAGAPSVVSMLDNALRQTSYPIEPKRAAIPKRINLLWAGRLVRWKGLDLALAAMKQVGPGAHVRLTIAGDGPLRKDFESSVQRLGLNAVVTFRGRVPWEAMSKTFIESDAFLFTSLRDSFGSVVLEAAAYSLPVITLDIGGAGTFLPAAAAIKISPSTVRTTASAIAAAILRLRDDAQLRQDMGSAARQFAESMQWEKHAETMWRVYLETSGRKESQVGYEDPNCSQQI